MTEEIKPARSYGEKGQIVTILVTRDGREFKLVQSPFDVSTLVSGLYAARAEALKQPVDDAPEIILPLERIAVLSDAAGNDPHFVLRVYLSAELYQDFAPAPGSPLHDDLATLATVVTTGLDPKASGPSGGSSQKH